MEAAIVMAGAALSRGKRPISPAWKPSNEAVAPQANLDAALGKLATAGIT
jgi:hypothetical protein